MSYQISYQPIRGSRYDYMASDGRLFATEQAVVDYCELMNAYFAAMEPLNILPSRLGRADYEAACAAHRVRTLTDAECDTYGVRYGVYAAPEYSVDVCVEMALARRRLNAILDERKVQYRPTAKPAELVRCTCGHNVPRSLVMSASLGTSCPDCYDRMSDTNA